jgi:ornithine cyclodeaminase/alanine dehydrogenase-like protein (mu-crystallin family)
VNSIRLLSESDVDATLKMKECIEVIDRAMRAFSANTVAMPPRLTTKLEDRGDYLCMPAAIPAMNALGMKCISIIPGNAA